MASKVKLRALSKQIHLMEHIVQENAGINNCTLQTASCLENLLSGNNFLWAQLEEQAVSKQSYFLYKGSSPPPPCLFPSLPAPFPPHLRRSGREKLCLFKQPQTQHTNTHTAGHILQLCLSPHSLSLKEASTNLSSTYVPCTHFHFHLMLCLPRPAQSASWLGCLPPSLLRWSMACCAERSPAPENGGHGNEEEDEAGEPEIRGWSTVLTGVSWSKTVQPSEKAWALTHVHRNSEQSSFHFPLISYLQVILKQEAFPHLPLSRQTFLVWWATVTHFISYSRYKKCLEKKAHAKRSLWNLTGSLKYQGNTSTDAKHEKLKYFLFLWWSDWGCGSKIQM